MAFAYILHNAIDGIDMENMLPASGVWVWAQAWSSGYQWVRGTKYSAILNSARIQHTFA